MRDLHHLPPTGATPSGALSMEGALSIDGMTAGATPPAHTSRVALHPDTLSRATPSPCRHGVLRPAPT